LNQYKRFEEGIATWGLPLVTIICSFILTIWGKSNLFKTMGIVAAVLGILLLLYLAVSFLEKREKRWEGNRNQHKDNERRIEEQSQAIEHIKQDLSNIKEKMDLYQKINKLELLMEYKRGKR